MRKMTITPIFSLESESDSASEVKITNTEVYPVGLYLSVPTCSSLGFTMGNPQVLKSKPIPLPGNTYTRLCGYGFLVGKWQVF